MTTRCRFVFKIPFLCFQALKTAAKNMKKTHFEEMTALTSKDELVKMPFPLPW